MPQATKRYTRAAGRAASAPGGGEAPVPDAPPLIACDRLVVGYAGPMLPPVDVAVRAGELWAVVGPNGAGKTTWMRTMLGFLPPVSGEIRSAPGLRTAYVPQAASIDPIYPVRVRDVVAMGRLRPGRFLGPLRQDDEQACREALQRTGADHLWDRPVRDLSGGQRQRVLVARALASQAALLFFDEPTGNLDRMAEEGVVTLIDELRRDGRTACVVITHLLQVLRGRADRALLLDREGGRAVAGTAAQVSRSEAFRHLFGEYAGAGGAP